MKTYLRLALPALLAAAGPIASWAAPGGGATPAPTGKPGAAPPATSAAAPSLRIRGAPVLRDGRPRVRLLWFPTTDWLPPEGLDVFRRVGSGEWVRRNPAPIEPSYDLEGTPMKALGTALQARKLRAWMDQARVPDTAARPATLERAFRRPPSRVGEFGTHVAEAKSRSATPGAAPRLPPKAVAALVPVRPEAPSRLRTEADYVRSARLKVVFEAMQDPKAALAAGLAWEDDDVASGARYQYSVRRSSPATDLSLEIGRLEVSVRSGGGPAAPTGLRAEQTGVGRVELRWDRPSPEAMADGDLVGWNLARVAAGREARLNRKPVSILDRLSEAGGDELEEPLSFFLDGEAPVGTVGYRLTMLDMFGRESPPAQVSVMVEDWRTPSPVAFAEAELDGQDVRVLWAPSVGAEPVGYRIFRVDTERGGDPVSRTEALVPGEPVARGQPLPPRLARVVAAGARSRPPRLAAVGAPGGAGKGTDPKGGAGKPLLPAAGGAGAAAATPASLVPSWLQFVDRAPPRDAYYRYLVVAESIANGRRSEPQPTGLVPVPDHSRLAAPSSLSTGPLEILTSAQVPRFPMVGAYPDVESLPGVAVSLSWSPVPGATSYRVWRTPASKYVIDVSGLQVVSHRAREAVGEAVEDLREEIAEAAGAKPPPLVTGQQTVKGKVKEITGIPHGAFKTEVVGRSGAYLGGTFPLDGRMREGKLLDRLKVELGTEVLPAGAAMQKVDIQVEVGTAAAREALGGTGGAGASGGSGSRNLPGPGGGP